MDPLITRERRRKYRAGRNMKHGERYAQLKQAYLNNDVDVAKAKSLFKKLPKRMPREAAMWYYYNKLRKVWAANLD